MNQYDEIKNLLKKSRMLVEQSAPVNIDADIEQDIDVETSPEDKTKTYRVSGGLIKLHGKDCVVNTTLKNEKDKRNKI